MLDEATLSAAARTLSVLRGRGMTAATAESCTGGLVAASLTHHAGSSDVVLGGFVTYSNSLKHHLLGVDKDVLERVGAVSEPVALAMASGALLRSGASCAVSITGIAGPGGGSPEKPVGLVWLATACTGREPMAVRHLFKGSRAEIRMEATRVALGLLEQCAG
jgi:nicotinamide-nucleotide amidase